MDIKIGATYRFDTHGAETDAFTDELVSQDVN